MGLLIEYFAAGSDDAAAATIDGGPSAAGFAVLDEWAIEPSIQLANLEEVLTGRDWQAIAADGDGIVESRDGGEQLILRLSERLASALVAADADELARAAEPWSQAEEFYGQADPEMLTEFLGALAGLVRQAGARGEHVCCWASV